MPDVIRTSKMKHRSKIWREPPPLALPDDPAFFSHCDAAWLAYETTGDGAAVYAIVRFDRVIDFHLSPINDEGLGSHPYASLGLRSYEFNELFDTKETRRWDSLSPRHFVITFKDVTIDVVCGDVVVLEIAVPSDSPREALRRFGESQANIGG